MEPGALPASQVPVFDKDTKSFQLGEDILKHLLDSYKDFSQVLGDSGFCTCPRECRQSSGKNPAVPPLPSGFCRWLGVTARI